MTGSLLSPIRSLRQSTGGNTENDPSDAAMDARLTDHASGPGVPGRTVRLYDGMADYVQDVSQGDHANHVFS